MEPILIGILGICIVLLIIFLYFFFNSSISSLAKNVYLNSNPAPSLILGPNIKNPASSRFAYSIWININTWNNPKSTTTDSPLFWREGEIGLSLDNTKPILNCVIRPNNQGVGETKTIITTNMPIQTWVNVIISVDNSFLDLYINGQLVQSIVMKDNSTPQKQIIISPSVDASGLSATPITFGTGDITLARFQRIIHPITPQEAYYMYSNGNGLSVSSGYNLNFSLFNNGELYGSYTY
jgi:hypothetical protein